MKNESNQTIPKEYNELRMNEEEGESSSKKNVETIHKEKQKPNDELKLAQQIALLIENYTATNTRKSQNFQKEKTYRILAIEEKQKLIEDWKKTKDLRKITLTNFCEENGVNYYSMRG